MGNLDKMAFNIQQLRNRYQTHLDERKRIEMAASPKQCALNIESFVQNNIDPLDNNNQMNNNGMGNLFRKRRPIKFPKVCHVCCCCLVACIRCCGNLWLLEVDRLAPAPDSCGSRSTEPAPAQTV